MTWMDYYIFRPLTRNQPILLPGEKEATKGPELDGEMRVSGLTSVPSLNIKNNLTLSDITVIVDYSNTVSTKSRHFIFGENHGKNLNPKSLKILFNSNC